MPINENTWAFAPRPFDISAADRIAELADAIVSAVRSGGINRNLIEAARHWAYELDEQLGLIETMLYYTDVE